MEIGSDSMEDEYAAELEAMVAPADASRMRTNIAVA
jgi:hypothetical protein